MNKNDVVRVSPNWLQETIWTCKETSGVWGYVRHEEMTIDKPRRKASGQLVWTSVIAVRKQISAISQLLSLLVKESSWLVHLVFCYGDPDKLTKYLWKSHWKISNIAGTQRTLEDTFFILLHQQRNC